MFERFTDRARRAITLTQDEARRLRHDYIGTEHILLGLIRVEDGLAAKALRSLGLSPEDVRGEVEAITGTGQGAPSEHIPFTARAKKVLELSLRESLALGHNYIGTEHILLGLVREGEGIAAQVLVRLGVDLSTTREQILHLLADPGDRPKDREWTPPRLRSARDRVLAAVEPVWRPLYRKTTPRTRALMATGLSLGVAALVRARRSARRSRR